MPPRNKDSVRPGLPTAIRGWAGIQRPVGVASQSSPRQAVFVLRHFQALVPCLTNLNSGESGVQKPHRQPSQRICSELPYSLMADAVRCVRVGLPAATTHFADPELVPVGSAVSTGVTESLCDSFAHQKSLISGDAVSPLYSAPFGRSVESWGLAPISS